MEFSTHFHRVFLYSLIPLVKAYTVFETTCSTPNAQSDFMFVSAPNTRGTLSILWTALFTIFACTWTVQHLSIPSPRNGRGHGKPGGLKWKLKEFKRNMYWMFVTIMAPEFIMAEAADDPNEARRLKKEMQKYAKEDGVAWTLTHSFFAGMGGFVIRNILPERRLFYSLSAKQVFRLRYKYQIKSLPDITAKELKDRSKSDVLGKTVAIGQILWTIVQVIARAVQKLPVSPLEVAVVAFAVCAVFTYGMYWEKPQRVLTHIEILDHMLYDDKKGVLKEILEENPAWQRIDYIYRDLLELGKEPHAPEFGPHLDYQWQKSYALDRWRQRNTIVVACIGATVFGAVHLIAWDFGFPTSIERLCWRCVSIYLTVSPLAMALVSGIQMALGLLTGNLRNALLNSLLAFLAGLYVVARLFILVEMFRTLFFLPAGSFVSTWASNIPHVG